jgi:hypothetical protein
MLIDLRKLREPLVVDIRRSLAAFSTQNPATPICTVGLWGDGPHGTASLHLDTPDHRDAYVEEWLRHGPGWTAEDRHGRFRNTCWDFTYCIGEHAFPGHPDLCGADVDAPVEYITLDGAREVVEADEGDAGKHRVVFPFLKAVLAGFEPFPELRRVAPFRVGVEMRRSRYAELWVLNVETGGS